MHNGCDGVQQLIASSELSLNNLLIGCLALLFKYNSDFNTVNTSDVSEFT